LKLSLLTLASLVLLGVSASAQITPIGPFTGDASEGFETEPPQNGVQCLMPRVFSDRGELCAASGLGMVAANGVASSGTIFSHSGMNLAAGLTSSVVLTFDSPVQSFGGYFGTVAAQSNGVASFFDVNGALIGMQPIVAHACTLNCGWTWNGCSAGSGPLIKHIEMGTGNGTGAGLALDDLTAQFGSVATGMYFCSGDLTGTACPCNNHSSPPPRGCYNSTFLGARVLAGGTPSLTSDSVVLYAEYMPPSASALFFQGTTRVNGGAGVQYGDGLRCAGGTIVRLGVKVAQNGNAHYPGIGDASVSVRGQVSAPGSRTYQVWYRDPPSFCTAAPYNMTNGYEIAWAP
jgi:hypothetical protein